MPDAVIVDAVRSPIGRAFKGSLTSIRPDDLGAYVVDQLLERNPEVAPESIEDLICGCGLPQGEQSFNIGRIITLLSRLPDSVTGTTVHRYCASSLQAIRIAAHAVMAGEGDAYIAAGVEHVSRVGMWSENGLPQLMGAIRQQAPEDVRDNIPQADFQNEKLNGQDGRTNAYIDMGMTAENVADKYDVPRDEMDKYAQRSQELAVQSRDEGFFDREIVPIELPDGNTVEKDDGPRADSTLEKLQSLKPAFKEDGRVTAGNSCPLNDGAAAVLVMSDTRAKELGLKPRARVIAS
ncbi:MAG TPA: acetyl-CoA C-acyltransferase, partial [Thermoleophilaceae bacterium]